MLSVSGDKMLIMEKQRFFNYASPIYLSNVFVVIMALAVGGTSLLKISQIAEKEREVEKAHDV